MQVKHLNLGLPREVETPRGVILTSIFKSPVSGRIPVRGYNLVGDQQSDLSVHGGPAKAIYAYPSEHYPYWEAKLQHPLTPGNFGENLTTEGLVESDVQIGDHYRIGTAVLNITQPRMPCYKLNLRFDSSTMVKLFWKSEFSGFYFGVVEEGEIAAGDSIELLDRLPETVTIAEVVKVYKGQAKDDSLIERVLAAPISGSWKQDIFERMNS